MKNIRIIWFFLICLGCVDGGGDYVDLALTIRVQNEEGENLLGTIYKEKDIDLTYWDGSKVYDPVWGAGLEPTSAFEFRYSHPDSIIYMVIWLDGAMDSTTAFVDWGNNDVDTINAIIDRGDNQYIYIEQMWYNDEIVSKPNNSDQFHLVLK